MGFLEIDFGALTVISTRSIHLGFTRGTSARNAEPRTMNATELRRIRSFWVKVLDALSRLLALGIFGTAHYLLDKGLQKVFDPSMTKMVTFARDVVSVLFLLVYIYLCWGYGDRVYSLFGASSDEATTLGKQRCKESYWFTNE